MELFRGYCIVLIDTGIDKGQYAVQDRRSGHGDLARYLAACVVDGKHSTRLNANVRIAASPDAQTQSPLTEQIDQCIVFGEEQGMTQRQISNGRVQADALRALGGSGQHNSRIRTDQRMVWSEIPVMFPDPVCIKTETFRLDNLVKKLRVESGERALVYTGSTRPRLNTPVYGTILKLSSYNSRLSRLLALFTLVLRH